jgi:protein gp37
MSDVSSIEWTDATWNVITGCSIKSAGCKNCYAMRLAGTRLQHHPSRAGLTRDSAAGPVWTGEVRFNEQWLEQPLLWRRPRQVFVCAHGDLFHENVPDAWLNDIFGVMSRAHWHTFQVLTKRADRAFRYLTPRKALPNVWLGVSVEDQLTANERIPVLLKTPAAVHWISAEPLLGAIDLRSLAVTANGRAGSFVSAIDWVVVGGESGARARPMRAVWAQSLRDQCISNGVPFLFKQWGTYRPPLTRQEKQPAGKWRELVLETGEIRRVHFVGDRAADETELFVKLGKGAAGRLLDGVQHDGFPEEIPPW